MHRFVAGILLAMFFLSFGLTVDHSEAASPDVVAVHVDQNDVKASKNMGFGGPCTSGNNAVVLAFYRAYGTDYDVWYDGAIMVDVTAPNEDVYDVPTDVIDSYIASICAGRSVPDLKFFAVRR